MMDNNFKLRYALNPSQNSLISLTNLTTEEDRPFNKQNRSRIEGKAKTHTKINSPEFNPWIHPPSNKRNLNKSEVEEENSSDKELHNKQKTATDKNMNEKSAFDYSISQTSIKNDSHVINQLNSNIRNLYIFSELIKKPKGLDDSNHF